MKRCAFTIASRNYIPAARTLGQSLAQQHPGLDFWLVLVDEFVEGDFEPDEPFAIIRCEHLDLPDFELSSLKYSIVELNTSVKPHAFSWFFANKDYDNVIYFDPDIYIYSDISDLFAALESSDVILTPHMLSPAEGSARPSDLDILKTGAYNLGFIALSRSENTKKLLSWWQDKLFNDCIIDLPNSIFVDQKWIDLVPSLFDKVGIWRNPGCNVAYWNFHERWVAGSAPNYTVDGRRLMFFHFSGYSPLAPWQASKHPHGRALADDVVLEALHADYAAALLANGYVAFQAKPYKFDRLQNGVRLTPVLRRTIRDLIAEGLPFPHPAREPDAFWRFACGSSATPAPVTGSADVLARSDEPHGVIDPIEQIFIDIELAPGLLAKFPGLLAGGRAYDYFIAWADIFGARELGWSAPGRQRLRGLQASVREIFGIYYSSPNLLEDWPDLGDDGDLAGFMAWLGSNPVASGLDVQAIRLFGLAARDQGAWLSDVAYFQNPAARGRRDWPDFFTLIQAGGRYPRSDASGRRLAALLQDGPPLYEQREIWRANDRRHADRNPITATAGSPPLPQMSALTTARVLEVLREPFRSSAVASRINIAGHRAAPTGMGESVRGLARAAEAVGYEIGHSLLPTPVDDGDLEPAPFIFGVPLPNAETAVCVANATAADRAYQLLPSHFWAERNIGYWTWETDRLPRSHARAARLFDEIWTPSETCCTAIANVVDLPVRVLPHSLDFAAVRAARARRDWFDLPESVVLFGYVFDIDSGVERKNPHGLIEAFKRAFGADPDVMLVLKISRWRGGASEARLRAAADAPNIKVITGPLSRQQSMNLIACLDVYCSLHRFEGFGLTCAEAMALGKPVIATAYSGNLDFMSTDCACLVPADIRPTPTAWGLYPAGSLWAEPDLDKAAAFMQDMRVSSQREGLGEAARQRVTNRLSPAAIGQRMQTLLNH